MTDNSQAKTIPELTNATSFAANDYIVGHDASSNDTVKIAGSLLRQSIVVGPYANDAVANTNGVLVGQPYYNANGVVYVRLL